MSLGSVLLLLLFCSLAAYLLFGAAFLKFRRGAAGIDLIPNAAFWTQTPGLVKDGAGFLLAKINKRSNYETLA